MAGRRNSLGRTLREWKGSVWSFLVRKLKSLGLVVDGIPASFCGLRGFAAVCQRPFHSLNKWSLRLFLAMVCITAQRELRGFLVCKQLSKIMTFILCRFFRSFISTSTNSPHSLSQRCNETVPCTCIPNVSSTRSLLVDLSVTSVTFLTSLNSTKTTILSWKVKVHGYS